MTARSIWPWFKGTAVFVVLSFLGLILTGNRKSRDAIRITTSGVARDRLTRVFFPARGRPAGSREFRDRIREGLSISAAKRKAYPLDRIPNPKACHNLVPLSVHAALRDRGLGSRRLARKSDLRPPPSAVITFKTVASSGLPSALSDL